MVYRIAQLVALIASCALAEVCEVVFINPITDAYLKNPHNRIYDPAYDGYKGHTVTSCFRAHQILFNERGIVLETHGDFALVRLFGTFFTYNGLRHSEYWVPQSSYVRISDCDQALFPVPFSWHDPVSAANQGIITLKDSYVCPKTGLCYSAATRFIATKLPNKKAYRAVRYDPESNTNHALIIPISYCAIQHESAADRKSYFVELLRYWVSTKKIPYVWGGASCGRSVAGKRPQAIHEKLTNKDLHYWVWPHEPLPREGADCSGIILRAAQAAGIPHFARNTSTMLAELARVPREKALEEGDLFCFTGHVMVVASLKKNTMIEAAGYLPSQYGYLHEIPIAQRFQGIKTCAELRTACEHGEPILLLKKNGEPSFTIENPAFLRME
jgi:cell wall-associated NlpC family hydrolase